MQTTPSPLANIFYVSHARTTSVQVDNIVSVSRRNNRRRGITGGMLYTGRYFAQVLEGPVDAIAETMRAIALDNRHDGVKPIFQGPLAVRRFAMWTMGYIVLPFADQLVIPLMTGSFDPQAGRALSETLLAAIGRDQGKVI